MVNEVRKGVRVLGPNELMYFGTSYAVDRDESDDDVVPNYHLDLILYSEKGTLRLLAFNRPIAED
jgi:hypothetical protein